MRSARDVFARGALHGLDRVGARLDALALEHRAEHRRHRAEEPRLDEELVRLCVVIAAIIVRSAI